MSQRRGRGNRASAWTFPYRPGGPHDLASDTVSSEPYRNPSATVTCCLKPASCFVRLADSFRLDRRFAQESRTSSHKNQRFPLVQFVQQLRRRVQKGSPLR